MRTRGWIGLSALAVAVALTAWIWLRHRDNAGHAHRATRSRLDVGAFRTQLATRLQRAKQIAARQQMPPVQPSPVAPMKKWPDQGIGQLPHFGHHMIEPECALGPHELCTTLTPLIAGCDDGDASDCLAVAQFIEDNPPRSAFAIGFFRQACRIGDAAGCERVDELMSNDPVPCERDPAACSWRAMRTNDRELYDETCSLGVAASCAQMAAFTNDEPDLSRAYLETGCQLGDPVMCRELGHRLQPDCEDTDELRCYEPDAEQAKAAIQIACEAGWESKSACEAIRAQ